MEQGTSITFKGTIYQKTYVQKVISREQEKSFKFQTHNYQPANNKGKETLHIYAHIEETNWSTEACYKKHL